MNPQPFNSPLSANLVARAPRPCFLLTNRMGEAPMPRRRGSILIMVVAVLVMLALMGTAYISVARLDRQTASPLNEARPEEVVEQLLPAIASMTEDVIRSDIKADGLYRPVPLLGAPSERYDHWDSPLSNYHDYTGTAIGVAIPANDAWLSVRMPELIPGTPLGDLVTWRVIGRPIDQQSPLAVDVEEVFRSPYRHSSAARQPTAPPLVDDMYGTSGDVRWTMDARSNRVAVTEITIDYPATYADGSLAGTTRVFPALALTDLAGGVLRGADGLPVKYLAADADGDGIADSGLSWIANLDGIDYYFATRIIDHGSAINVNTAWSMQGEYAFTGPGANRPDPSVGLWVFPSSVGLLEMLNTWAAGNTSIELDEINRFRNGYGLPDPPFANGTGGAGPFVAEAAPAGRVDFTYISQGDASYFGLTARLDEPGDNNTREYRPFKLADNIDLAYRFCLINPDGLVELGGVRYPRSDLEKLLNNADAADSVYHTAVNYTTNPDHRFRYLPADKGRYWFEYSFDLDFARRGSGWGPDAMPALGALPRRAMLTLTNAVSNSTQKHLSAAGNVPHDAMLPYASKGRWSVGYQAAVGYTQGDIVYHHAPWVGMPLGPGGFAPQVTLPFVCIANVTGTAPPQTDITHWAVLTPRGDYQLIGGSSFVGNIWQSGPGPAKPLYVCITNTSSAPGTDASWIAVPDGASPPRASLNTAPFAELFRAFWNVMAPDNPADGSPFDTAIQNAVSNFSGAPSGTAGFPTQTGGSFNDPYIGNRFEEYMYTGASGPAPFEPIPQPGDPAYHPAHMFRSCIRAVPNATGTTPTFDTMTPRMAADQMVLLRAAIAAVNTEDLRDSDTDITAREVMLKAYVGGGTEVPVQVVVYGNEPQPFITEVYVNNDCVSHGPLGAGNVNANGYVAIELYNPYPIPINMTNWVIARINRQNGSLHDRDDASTPDGPITPLADFASVTDYAVTYSSSGAVTEPIIPPYGYMILENYNSVASAPTIPGAAAYRPPSIINPAQQTGPVTPSTGAGAPEVVTVFVPGLGDAPGTLPLPIRTVCNFEMVILRPRRTADPSVSPPDPNPYSWFVSAADRSPGALPYPSGLPYDERPTGANRFRDMVPVDSFDFTGIELQQTDGGFATAWHYVRPSASLSERAFHFVYPGRYDAGNTALPLPRARHAGTQEAPAWQVFSTSATADTWAPGAMPGPPGHPAPSGGGHPPPPYQPGPSMSLTQVFDELSGTYTIPATVVDANSSISASYPTSFPIQLANGNFAVSATGMNVASIGHNPVLGAAGNEFPFGGFARAGDVLAVPFIGAYRIVDTSTGALLEINAITMDAAMAEDTLINGDPVGLVGIGASAYDVEVEQIGRFCPSWRPGTGAAPRLLTSYDWASNVLDYFTAIQNHHDDFRPNVDPARYPPGVPPDPVANTKDARANSPEDVHSPMEGLININTVSADVLARVPLVINSTGAIDFLRNLELAQAIVRYRDGDATTPANGPFKNLFELNNVIVAGNDGFYNMNGQLFANPGDDPGDAQGDFTPWDLAATAIGQPPADGVRDDYEERYLNIIRLSNLLTTRSDVFTCYVLVQGWKNTGTDTPQLVVERRGAFVVDRSRVSDTTDSLNVTRIPTR